MRTWTWQRIAVVIAGGVAAGALMTVRDAFDNPWLRAAFAAVAGIVLALAILSVASRET